MGFNQTYSAINRAWEANFEGRVPEREMNYVSNKMKRLQTAFQNEQYQKAIATTKTLFGYFLRIAHKKSNPLRTPALKIVECFWSLEGILQRKL